MPTRSRQTPDRSVRRADAVVVLGWRVYPAGSASRGPIRRLERGIRLLQEGEASLLVLSGGASGPLPKPEIMRRAALARGIPEVALLSETRSRNTFGLLIKRVFGICDHMLAELKATHRHPPPVKEITVPETFRRFGAAGWDALRMRFRHHPRARRGGIVGA